MKKIKRIVNNIKFNSTVLGIISGAYTVNTLYNVSIVESGISLNNKNEFYATSLIYGVMMARFIYANYFENKKLKSIDNKDSYFKKHNSKHL